MKRPRVQPFARLIAVCALILQIVLPGSVAVAQSNGIDVSRFTCAAPGEASNSASDLSADLARIIAEHEPQPAAPGDHCPLCTLVHAVAPPVPLMVQPAPVLRAAPADFSGDEPRFAADARGPPVGARAPPVRI
ncbi:hypothetical protein GC169_09175 [bacterium]|nr:hypothetical protein [bacterium]